MNKALVVGGVLMLSIGVLLPIVRAGSNRSPEAYAEVTSLEEAVLVAKRPVDSKDGKVQGHPYDALLLLLTEDRVREAIPNAIKEYEALLERQDESAPDARDYFVAIVRPRLEQIVEEGAWPKGCYFDYFPVDSSDGGVSGYCLTLEVMTPDEVVAGAGTGKRFDRFALPIIKVSFGRFGS